MVLQGKAEGLEHDLQVHFIRSRFAAAHGDSRLRQFVRVPSSKLSAHRRTFFQREQPFLSILRAYQGDQLSIDHVIPRKPRRHR